MTHRIGVLSRCVYPLSKENLYTMRHNCPSTLCHLPYRQHRVYTLDSAVAMGAIAVRKDGEVLWIWFEMFRAELFSTIALRPFTVSYNFKVLGAIFLTVSNAKKGLFPVLTRLVGKCVYASALEGVEMFAFRAVYVGAKPRQNQPGAETT
jgi:hypothetical protein